MNSLGQLSIKQLFDLTNSGWIVGRSEAILAFLRSYYFRLYKLGQIQDPEACNVFESLTSRTSAPDSIGATVISLLESLYVLTAIQRSLVPSQSEIEDYIEMTKNLLDSFIVSIDWPELRVVITTFIGTQRDIIENEGYDWKDLILTLERIDLTWNGYVDSINELVNKEIGLTEAGEVLKEILGTWVSDLNGTRELVISNELKYTVN